ncbi:DUF4392 domain-containing protein [Oscillibacter sp. MSJ-2]|uniref:DUF4392 domain-containing protein n=1 Tax=Dysosmobacter acutus TaxID=2841504 RepID=A0ABS6F6P2_9FIRM|nr:DUF4392 domain-containing protein [Dysosmobacter acutus]MBU5625926.1 DUF4392 domain-containing protein [Dysosmobacter acutus]
MDFEQMLYEQLRQGSRGLRAPMPALRELSGVLLRSRSALVLTGFPVDCGTVAGETDGPIGAAEIAGALTAIGCQVEVATDAPSYRSVEEALELASPEAGLTVVPFLETGRFIRRLFDRCQPDLVLAIERPGKGMDGHFHNMRGAVIDRMTADTDSCLQLARQRSITTVAIGDGGNELGMGALYGEVCAHVPHGVEIAAVEPAQFTLAAGVSNWWGAGLAALLSHATGRELMLSEQGETELLRAIVGAGAVDGCTGRRTMSVDGLELSAHLKVRRALMQLLKEQETLCG